MKVKVRKLHEDAKTPQYAKDGDAGMDLVALTENWCDQYVEFGTGLAFEIPEGYVGLLFPRSSISKKDMVLANSVGVIDSGYRGEVSFRFKLTGMQELYKVGDRIGQIVIMPFPKIEFEIAESLSSTERGAGGYGSTGGH